MKEENRSSNRRVSYCVVPIKKIYSLDILVLHMQYFPDCEVEMVYIASSQSVNGSNFICFFGEQIMEISSNIKPWRVASVRLKG